MIQPLGPGQIWQKLNAFTAANQTRIENHLSPSFIPMQELPQPSSENLFSPLGMGEKNNLVPLSPFGPHANIMGLENTTGLISNKLKAPTKYRDLIIQAAQKADIDPNLFDILVAVESDYRPHLVSRAGAMGLAQLMPETATSLGVTDPFDPKQNLEGGARYLSQMLKRFGGNLELALAAYTAGPNAVERYGSVPPYKATQKYVKKILDQYPK